MRLRKTKLTAVICSLCIVFSICGCSESSSQDTNVGTSSHNVQTIKETTTTTNTTTTKTTTSQTTVGTTTLQIKPIQLNENNKKIVDLFKNELMPKGENYFRNMVDACKGKGYDTVALGDEKSKMKKDTPTAVMFGMSNSDDNNTAFEGYYAKSYVIDGDFQNPYIIKFAREDTKEPIDKYMPKGEMTFYIGILLEDGKTVIPLGYDFDTKRGGIIKPAFDIFE